MEQREIQLRGGGRLTIWEDGQLVQLRASRTDDGRGLYKVWVRGAGGRLLLGTLGPERNGLHLFRRLSRSQLERSGCWPITGGEAVLAFSFASSQWRMEAHPEQLVRDEVLCRAVRGQAVRLKSHEGGFCMAVPFHTDHPFSITPLFCLSEIQFLDGKAHAVFHFNGDGVPITPYNGSRSGKNSGTS